MNLASLLWSLSGVVVVVVLHVLWQSFIVGPPSPAEARAEYQARQLRQMGGEVSTRDSRISAIESQRDAHIASRESQVRALSERLTTHRERVRLQKELLRRSEMLTEQRLEDGRAGREDDLPLGVYAERAKAEKATLIEVAGRHPWDARWVTKLESVAVDGSTVVGVDQALAEFRQHLQMWVDDRSFFEGPD